MCATVSALSDFYWKLMLSEDTITALLKLMIGCFFVEFWFLAALDAPSPLRFFGDIELV